MVLTLQRTHNKQLHEEVQPHYIDTVSPNWLQPGGADHHWCPQQLLMNCGLDPEEKKKTMVQARIGEKYTNWD